MSKRSALLLFILHIVGLPTLCYAQNAQKIERQLERQKQEQQVLQRQAGEVERELLSTRSKLVKTGETIQQTEKKLLALEERMDVITQRKADLLGQLKHERVSTARVLLALERLRRVPPEALLARPNATLAAAQTSFLLNRIVSQLVIRTKNLQAKLAELNDLTAELKVKRDQTRNMNERLAEEKKSLSHDAKKREKLYASLNEDLKTNEEAMRKIAAEAQSLRDLVYRLDKEKRTASANTSSSHVKNAGTRLPSRGRARPPVGGVIVVSYGQPDAFNAPSQGITIESRDKALVVSPMGGIIRFAGDFKNYGQMVIVEHKNGYHSLIAGLQKIDTFVGQSVSAGEPVGLLGRGKDLKSRLYYELRQNGRPVNPATLLGELS